MGDALADTLQRIPSSPRREPPVHRLPLGLLLLSRHQLTREQLQTALAAQRSAGHGRLGEWLQALEFATETQVTAALARQWSCPIFLSSASFPGGRHVPQIPISLLQHFSMVPVHYVESTSTLHLAFSEGVDYTVLYAIEQMTGCHTEACFATPAFVRAQLAPLCAHRAESEIVFSHFPDVDEVCSMIRSYCSRLHASEMKVARCGSDLWVRLLRNSRSPLDLILHSPAASAR
ncbi:MAG TPA: hypothetical protein VGS05_11130 [Candidatus Sulfotelmatobacter sp.]|nr:hypothetical protein [Candidatus Sulfotelmatobacter sp.]